MDSTTYDAVDIAKIFVQKGIDDSRPVTQMKLQKLVYFAHGLYLAATEGSPLIKEDFQAWQFGPVVPSIYHAFKLYGNGEIYDFDYVLQANVVRSFPREVVLNNYAAEIIEITWEMLKNTKATQLSNWTHKPDSAWSKVYKPNRRDILIPNEEIIRDFEHFITENPEQNG